MNDTQHEPENRYLPFSLHFQDKDPMKGDRLHSLPCFEEGRSCEGVHVLCGVSNTGKLYVCFSRWGKFLLQISERHLLRSTYFQSNMTIADTSSSNTKLFIWDKVFKNGSSKICTLTGHTTSNFSKAVFCKFYLVHC